MKLAIVCDDLIQFGGAERVLEVISDMYPDAPIYTSVASKRWLDFFEKKGRIVKTSFLQKFPFSIKLNRYYSTLLLHILAFESFDFSDFDIVLSCSSRFAHFVITKPQTKHICYTHSPGRMFWEPFDYFERESFGFLKPIKSLSKSFLKLPLMYLRVADFNASKKVDTFIANSKTTQERIKKYYGRESGIVYPSIKYETFKNVDPLEGEYFLVISRLSPWKKVEIAVKACCDLKEKLKIIGIGPDLERLKEISSKSLVDFLGYIDDEDKVEVIRRCKAVIFTQKEDFGIVPLEAMACGKPVIAFGSGGATETVLPGKTGEFFDEQTVESLKKVLEEFDSSKYRAFDCKERAREFDVGLFEGKVRDLVNNV